MQKRPIEKRLSRLHQIVAVASLLLLFLFAGCSSYMASNAGKIEDEWNTKIYQVPLDQLSTLEKGDQLLVTLRDGTEFKGKLSEVVQDTTLVIRAEYENGQRETWTVNPSRIWHLRKLDTPTDARRTGYIFGIMLDIIICLAAANAFSTIIIL